MDWTSGSESDENHDSGRDIRKAGSALNPPEDDWVGISDSDEIPDVASNTDVAERPPSCDVADASSKELASEAGPSHTNWISHFVAMGFSEELVAEAIKQNREGDSEGILETLLTYGAIEKSHKHGNPAESSPASGKNRREDGISEFEDCGVKDSADDSEKDKIVSTLVEMGFHAEEASSAIDRCGPTASIFELADSIGAAQAQENSSDQLWESSVFSSGSDDDEEDSAYVSYKEKMCSSEFSRKNKRVRISEREEYWKKMRANKGDDLEPIPIPKEMKGFGLPLQTPRITHRKLPEAAIGPPFFYYENAVPSPRGVWEVISRFLYDIEPEFVDSKYFSAVSIKRGYIHNLPIRNRFPLRPIPPKTIHEAFPTTKKWWPSWDTRTHLHCSQMSTGSGKGNGSAKRTEDIRLALAQSDYPPPERTQRYILEECRKWDLVWVGLHKVAPLEPEEIEMLLGFPKNHTRGISRTERYKSLGNSLQIDTIAFHLSVLKDMFPNGITVLSVFTGIGGAAVALYRLGIRLKTVVLVEPSAINRDVVRSWWEQTNQSGTLIDISDVQQLNSDRLEHLVHTYGGFDLVIGGSPCSNLAGSSRYSRDGLGSEHLSAFYDYFRILDLVKCLMERS